MFERTKDTPYGLIDNYFYIQDIFRIKFLSISVSLVFRRSKKVEAALVLKL
jgi:hypothetical protein